MSPLLSIIVPIYNMKEYISKCIDSILAQTFTDYELVLVNDGSTDESGIICEEYAKKDERIKVVNQKNGGLSDARNSGIEVSIGKYLAFVDGDDSIEKEMYKTLINLAELNEADIVCCKYRKVAIGDLANIKIFHTGNIYLLTNEQALTDLYTEEKISFIVCDKIYKRELFKNIKFEKDIILEDVLILPQLFYSAERIISIEAPYYNYLQRPNSIITSGLSFRKFESSIYVFQKNIAFFQKKNTKLYYHAEKMFYSSLINWCIRVDRSCQEKDGYFAIIQLLIRKNAGKIMGNSYITTKWKILLLLSIVSLRFIILYGKINSYLINRKDLKVA